METPGLAVTLRTPRIVFSRTRDWSYNLVSNLVDQATQYIEEIEQFMTADNDSTQQKDATPSSPGNPVKGDARKRSENGAKISDSNEKEKAKERKEKDKKAESDDSASLIDRISGLTNSAYRLARKTTGTSFKVGKAIIKSQDQLKVMLAAGQSLRDLREVAGLTLSDMADAINLKDKTLLEAVENGTATLSFELILRLAALLARNDPIPFILKYTRTYSPETWRILHDWGIGRIPLHFERERNFINIYRSHDAARKLSDEGFEKVLEFTRKAFELSLHFIAEQEQIDALGNDEDQDENQTLAEEIKQRHRKDIEED